jgi:hypothetical protein
LHGGGGKPGDGDGFSARPSWARYLPTSTCSRELRRTWARKGRAINSELPGTRETYQGRTLRTWNFSSPTLCLAPRPRKKREKWDRHERHYIRVGTCVFLCGRRRRLLLEKFNRSHPWAMQACARAPLGHSPSPTPPTRGGLSAGAAALRARAGGRYLARQTDSPPGRTSPPSRE